MSIFDALCTLAYVQNFLWLFGPITKSRQLTQCRMSGVSGVCFENMKVTVVYICYCSW